MTCAPPPAPGSLAAGGLWAEILHVCTRSPLRTGAILRAVRRPDHPKAAESKKALRALHDMKRAGLIEGTSRGYRPTALAVIQLRTLEDAAAAKETVDA